VNVRPKAWQGFFFGDSHAANRVILFNNQDLEPCPGQVAGTGQAVVPRADDDGVVMMRHVRDELGNFSVAPSAQNAKLRALTKAESSALLNDGFVIFTDEIQWPKVKSTLSARY
jgi:hypothetical protein